MNKLYLILGIFLFTLNQSQVGIGTNNPDASAILEVMSIDKGFKAPNVKLLSKTDILTIASPEAGLLVFNTDAAGVFPNNVVANEYYFFNGTEWINIASTKQIEELLVPGIYVINEDTSQALQPGINTALSYQTVEFSSSAPLVDKGNIITKSGNLFTVNRTGLYEVTANVNYNPAREAGTFRLSTLNISVQSRKSGTTSWADKATARRSWGNGSTNSFQTAFVPNTCIFLEVGDEVRLAVAYPLAGPDLQHGANARIASSATEPISKSFSIQLINY